MLIYMVIGCPGAGKSWVCNQLVDKYEYIAHDDYKHAEKYLQVILTRKGARPLLIETPFSISKLKDPLETAGHHVVPVFIIEDAATVSARYAARENKPIPQSHLTRQTTYAHRAAEWGAFAGTSTEVLEHLRRG
jgi:hypothetical protein